MASQKSFITVMILVVMLAIFSFALGSVSQEWWMSEEPSDGINFVGSVAVYNHDELYFIHAGLIQNFHCSDGYVYFWFEGNHYMYLNYQIEVIS